MSLWTFGSSFTLRVVQPVSGGGSAFHQPTARSIGLQHHLPRRYDGSASLVKHAGLSPSENASGAFAGQTRISRRGRPGLLLAVWRAVWPMLHYNPVMAAKYAALTRAAGTAADAAGSRQLSGMAAEDRARRAKARVECAASLLRWIYTMVVHDTSWDPVAGAAAAQHAPRRQAEAA